MDTTRILIADDHPVFREGVRNLLDEQDELEVIGQANDGAEAIQMALDLKPDVVLMDIMMPNVNGIEATKEIKTSIHMKSRFSVTRKYTNSATVPMRRKKKRSLRDDARKRSKKAAPFSESITPLTSPQS